MKNYVIIGALKVANTCNPIHAPSVIHLMFEPFDERLLNFVMCDNFCSF